jgi:hypothetical protein
MHINLIDLMFDAGTALEKAKSPSIERFVF